MERQAQPSSSKIDAKRPAAIIVGLRLRISSLPPIHAKAASDCNHCAPPKAQLPENLLPV
jgi:hypothetical protein